MYKNKSPLGIPHIQTLIKVDTVKCKLCKHKKFEIQAVRVVYNTMEYHNNSLK